jgi:uncharacterized protein
MLCGCMAVAISGIAVYREARQQTLNRDLIAAIKRNDSSQVAALLHRGAEANALDLPADTRTFWHTLLDLVRGTRPSTASSPAALMVALNVPVRFESFLPAYEDTAPVVGALLDHGADVKALAKNGQTPLLIAAEHAHWETMHLLLNKNAPVDRAGNSGNTPLILAAQVGQTALVRRLLDKGARVDVMGDFGTALHAATGADDLECARLLLDHGADVNARDRYDASPLISVASRLSAHTDDGHLVVSSPESFRLQTQFVALLLERGAAVNIQDEVGDTALQCALFNQWDEAAGLLLKRHADVNLADDNHYTPLMAASRRGNLSLVKTLLARGANPLIRSNQGETALLEARKAGHHAIVEVLKKAGAK